jgi:hypothetical protein
VPLADHWRALASTFVFVGGGVCGISREGRLAWGSRCRISVKTATDSPEVVQTTTTRRVFPADSIPSEKKAPEFWAYLEALPSDWNRHLLYIYRRIGESGPVLPLEKCSGYMAMPGGSSVPLNNREEVEFAIASKYGGGTYRLILKNGSERVTEGRITAEGPAKNTQPQILVDNSPQVGADGATNNEVAKTAMHIVANREAEAISVGVSALKGAADVMQRFAQQPNAPSENDQLMRQLMVAMLQKALNPPDPIEIFTKLLPLLNHGGGGAANPLVDKIIEAGLDRVLNPAITGPVSSTGAELVRSLPQVVSHIGETVREWRLGSEAQLQTAALMAGKAALPPGAPGAPAVAAAAAVTPPRQQPAQARPTIEETAMIEFIETKIVEILAEATSADEAAEETFIFLDRVNQQLPKQLASAGEAGLMHLFSTKPILQQAMQNLPRLQDFIKAFLKYAAENIGDSPPVAPPPASVKPN